MKNGIALVKSTIERIHSRLRQAKDHISELENMIEKIMTQSENKK